MNLTVEFRHTNESDLPEIGRRAATTDAVDRVGGIAVVHEIHLRDGEVIDEVVGAVSFGIPRDDKPLAEVRQALIELDCDCTAESICQACEEVARIALKAISKRIILTHDGLMAPYPERLPNSFREQIVNYRTITDI